MSAVASNQSEGNVKEICKDVRDFDNYEKLEVEAAGPNVIVFKKDRLQNNNYPAQERLIVNIKTRSYHHVKIAVTRIESRGGKIREEISLTMNDVEFYFSSVSDKSAGLQPGDAQQLTLTPAVKKSMAECCKWLGVGETSWGECMNKLDVLGEFSRVFDICINLERRREEQKAEEALTPKPVESEQVKTKASETEGNKEAKPVKCLHNTADCKHVLKRRCFSCNKKVGMNGFICDCKKVFCNGHMTPLKDGDDLELGHLCEFDFKNQAQQKLKQAYAKLLDEEDE